MPLNTFLDLEACPPDETEQIHCRESNSVYAIICGYVISLCNGSQETFLLHTGKCFPYILSNKGSRFTHTLSYADLSPVYENISIYFQQSVV